MIEFALAGLLSFVGAGSPAGRVRVDDVDGVPVLSASARGITVREFAREAAQRLGVRWIDDAPDADARTLALEIDRRPVRSALEWAFGSVGLAFELREDSLRTFEPARERDELELGALAAYSRALSRFPDAPEADDARSAMIEIERARGNTTGALQHAQILAQTGHSPRTQAAGRRCAGALCEELGRWQDATEHFRALSMLDESNPETQVYAREELVRCYVHLENFERALLIAKSLESAYPATSLQVQEQRALLTGMALSGLDRGAEALAQLERVRIELLPPDVRLDALRALARALELDGRFGEAGKAWLAVAAPLTGAQRVNAIEHAARLALLDSDELGALLACSTVAPADETTALRVYRGAARRRLGLAADMDGSHGEAYEARLERLELEAETCDPREALESLGELLANGAGMPRADLLRTRLLRARLLARADGLDTAMAWLRETRALSSDAAERARCDLCAAQIFEVAQQFARAADAYEGRY
jgi:tetratricopeptide (TPR) repeat protein